MVHIAKRNSHKNKIFLKKKVFFFFLFGELKIYINSYRHKIDLTITGNDVCCSVCSA